MRVAVCLGSSNVKLHIVGTLYNKQKTWNKALSFVDNDHFEASDCGGGVCQRQAGLQHLCSHHAGDESDAMLHFSSRIQWEHSAEDTEDKQELTKSGSSFTP